MSDKPICNRKMSGKNLQISGATQIDSFCTNDRIIQNYRFVGFDDFRREGALQALYFRYAKSALRHIRKKVIFGQFEVESRSNLGYFFEIVFFGKNYLLKYISVK